MNRAALTFGFVLAVSSIFVAGTVSNAQGPTKWPIVPTTVASPESDQTSRDALKRPPVPAVGIRTRADLIIDAAKANYLQAFAGLSAEANGTFKVFVKGKTSLLIDGVVVQDSVRYSLAELEGFKTSVDRNVNELVGKGVPMNYWYVNPSKNSVEIVLADPKTGRLVDPRATLKAKAGQIDCLFGPGRCLNRDF